MRLTTRLSCGYTWSTRNSHNQAYPFSYRLSTKTSIFWTLLHDWFGSPDGYLATQRRQRGNQFVLTPRFAGEEVDAQSSVVSRTASLRRAAEDVLAPGDLESYETGGHDRDLKLCLQQSTGYSPSPEIYLSF